MSYIYTQSEALDIECVGGKAASLAKMAKYGFNPPDFFVVSADALSIKGNQISSKRGFEKLLESATNQLGAGPFAVRSSAQAEDGLEHSHAGQFETVLNVPKDKLLTAIKKVWKSGFSDTVKTYQDIKAGGTTEAPAIIIQTMINAQSAGVAFSADPVSGLRERSVISAIAGLGESLVSGERDGEDWVLDHNHLPISMPSQPAVLSLSQATEIAALVRKAETFFGYPQDIEWAFDTKGLHILQARPITTKLRAAPSHDNALTIFDNSNIVESYPGMVSPLTYSFAVHIYTRVYRSFVSLLGVSDHVIEKNASVFGNMLGRIDGRVYYNLVNWYRALALLPGFSLNRGYMETMMGVSEPMPKEITSTIGPPDLKGVAKIPEYLKLVRVALKMLWHAVRLSKTKERFYSRLNLALGRGTNLDQAGPTKLAKEYRTIETLLLDQWDAPLINDFFCMIAFGSSRNLLQKWLGNAGLMLHNDVMIGQGDIISAEPAQRIAHMGQIAKEEGLADRLLEDGLEGLNQSGQLFIEIQSYIEKFGDRCAQELKLESIPLSKDPSPLLSAIATSAMRNQTETKRPKDPDWYALLPNNPVRRFFAKFIVNWTKARVRDRENLRFERTRIFGYARRVFLAIGREFEARGILNEQRDVFYLTTQEVLGAIEGFGLSSNLQSVVELRKCEDTVSGQKSDPPERIKVRGPAIVTYWTDAPAPADDNSKTRKATGCSAGIVKAKARIITDPRTQKLELGDILIASHTDPGWISVFSNASAIVVERGSLLSHSAIVARELGIPCVVGLKNATSWIKDGEIVEVDGATGRVERINNEI